MRIEGSNSPIALNLSSVAKTLDTLNLDPVLLEPAQAKTFLQQETQRYGALVEKSGLEKQ